MENEVEVLTLALVCLAQVLEEKNALAQQLQWAKGSLENVRPELIPHLDRLVARLSTGHNTGASIAADLFGQKSL